jgi:hypothetical protein
VRTEKQKAHKNINLIIMWAKIFCVCKNLKGLIIYFPMCQVSRHVKQNFSVSIFMPFKQKNTWHRKNTNSNRSLEFMSWAKTRSLVFWYLSFTPLSKILNKLFSVWSFQIYNPLLSEYVDWTWVKQKKHKFWVLCFKL